MSASSRCDNDEDTIAAVSTPRGAGGIGIVRISGSKCLNILRSLVPRLPDPVQNSHVYVSWARHPSTREKLDRVICFFMQAPATYTGEDCAEIQGHGGIINMQRLLDAVCAAGARIAGPGEFTKRACLSGRMDLLAAEATAGFIEARTQRAARLAVQHLSGSTGRYINSIIDDIVETSAAIEAHIDFPEDGLEPLQTEKWLQVLAESIESLNSLSRSYDAGHRLMSGARVVLAGLPNAGKSTLFNTLAGQDRALVDPEPGTTRDFIEALDERDGLLITWVDTAGVRSSAPGIEAEGIRRTMKEIEKADITLLVVDGVNDTEEDLGNIAKRLCDNGLIICVNKKDLAGWDTRPAAAAWPDAEPFAVSASTGEGIDAVVREILKQLLPGDADADIMLFTSRQKRYAMAAAEVLERAVERLKEGSFIELAASDLYEARDFLGALSGRVLHEKVMDEIFSRFCIGK